MLNSVFKVSNDFEHFYDTALKDIGDGFCFYFFHVWLQPVSAEEGQKSKSAKVFFSC